ncbi:suppressor of fused domain protein [Clostridium scatologenes]|uniref:Suppressor of fused-like domain-containing protein n=1 Tax=Clostridium scatologenes TaxID=1548 RepID=A0A0E3M5F9_CLOSL|nr:suppressor of fused domain protein [Clostridium scatologenes]AKA68088.1 hypothetical protein CSCA_0963 [Clostridium scatologenes]
MNKKIDFSKSGKPIFKYDHVETGWRPPSFGVENQMEKIEEHIHKYFGEPTSVYHELMSDLIHLDVYYIKPNEDRNFHTFVTSGMSFIPMNPMEGSEDEKYAELIVCLPAQWPVSEEAFKDMDNYWPIAWLKMLARFPHDYKTWLGFAHTMPNYDPPIPIANTNFHGIMLLPPILTPQSAAKLQINEDISINFYCIIPLYKDEMQYKLDNGYKDILDKFDEKGINEVINIKRDNVCEKYL